MITRSRLFPALGLIGLALSGRPVDAQSFDASGPRRPLVIPSGASADVPRPVPAPAHIPAGGPAATPLRPFPALNGAPVIKGTGGTLAWPVALTGAQAAGDVDVILAPLSSIAVRPDTSFAEVAVNGAPIGRLRLGLPDTPATLRVPQRLLRAGTNIVAVTVWQDHRVDCSPQATFELSTTFDPAASGLAVAPMQPSSIADLAAAAPRLDGALVVSVVAERALPPDLVPRVARAVQAITLLTGALQPVVEIVPDATAATGVVLAIGPRAALGRVLPHDIQGGAASVFAGVRPGRAVVLAVAGETPEAIDTALAPLEAAAARTASERDASPTAQDTIVLAPNEAMARLAGPRAALAADILLPADAFPADYGQATVRISGALAADVLPTARLVVSVNGREAATTTLARGRWGQEDQATVRLPYGLLRPGRNRVDMALELPSPADAAYEPLRRTDDTRLMLSPASSIGLSPPARAARLPELAAVAAGGLPFITDGAVTLHVPRPDRGSLEAALTLSARLAVAAGRLMATAFTVAEPREPVGRVITVGPIGAIDPAAVAAAGLDRDRLAAAWATPRGREGGDDPCRVEADVEAPPAPRPVPPGHAVAPAGQGASAWFAMIARRGSDRLGLRRGPQDGGAGLAGTLDLMLAQSPEGALVVTARDSAMLAAGAACLSRPRSWDRLAGQAAGLDLATGAVAVVRPAAVSVVPTDWSPGNLRRVLAGWLSLNAYAYLAVSLFAAAALGVGTAGVVRRAGRSQP